MSKVDEKNDKNVSQIAETTHLTATIICSNCGLQQEAEFIDDLYEVAKFFIECGWVTDKKTEDPLCKHCSGKRKKKYKNGNKIK